MAIIIGLTDALNYFIFLCCKVAGIKFSFNPDKDPGCRILEDSVSINNEPLVKDKVCKP